ncbi:MAG TPA: YggS family pyridoxal phosphate-dependent enzyme [Candidatus Gallacutalibacter pullistercoris]|nr:YggS family pyridoxal phosphate-dependent enzyme [Candidatus Gallacutalibacter pullistercoris]
MTEKLSEELQARCRALEMNLQDIRTRIAAAAKASGRLPEEITLLAATKTVPVEVINHAIRLGVDHIGENRVQELEQKYDRLERGQCSVHFIGHLQTNKVKNLVGRVDMIQSVDSVRLAREISRLSVQRNVVTDILLEVNIGREENKSGVLPEELETLLGEITGMEGVSVRGLMAIPPICEEKERLRNYFSLMSEYFIDIKRKKSDNVAMEFLSMGMSGDFEDAILCGANIVRIGSSLFGQRQYT